MSSTVTRALRGCVGLTLGLAVIGGCKAREASVPPSTSPEPPTPIDTPDPEAQPVETEISKPVCHDGGRSWDGDAECLYEFAGCCYDGPAQACAAASCPIEQCQIIEMHPAAVHCRGTSPAQS